MTQVVPEHVARAKLGSGNNSVNKNRPQRSNSATLSTISVTCDTDTSIRSRNNRHQQSPSKKTIISNKNTANSMTTSHSSSPLINVSVNPLPTSFRNNYQYKSSGNSSSSIPTSLTTTSGMNIIHEKPTITSSASTISIQNKQLIKTTGGGGAAGGGSRTANSTKTLSDKHKATSFDDSHHRTAQTRGIGKSVLEHLVFVFPENVRRMLAGPKK